MQASPYSQGNVLWQGMLDHQLQMLTEVLKKGRIWALNVGENMNISRKAWEHFADELKHTNVSFMYVSEHHLLRTNLKQKMMDAIRDNRRCSFPPQEDVLIRLTIAKCSLSSNTWKRPKFTSKFLLFIF